MDVLDTISNRRKLITDEINVMVSSYRGDNLEIIMALADKIMHMCLNIGCPSSVKPMLQSIINGNVKMWATGLGDFYGGTLAEKGKQLHGYSTGRIHRTWKKADYCQGHFRWNHRAYMLTREDRDFLKRYFFEGIKEGGTNMCGINARTIDIYKVSDNLVRIVISTPKNNEYAMYYYIDKNQLQGNWLREDVIGADKTKVLKLIDKKYQTNFAESK